jgi:hypothetical protein
MFAGTAIKTVENKGPFHQEYINNFCIGLLPASNSFHISTATLGVLRKVKFSILLLAN